MIVNARSLALVNQGDRADNPLVGWDNAVTASNVTATSTESGYSVTNLGNPATNLAWRAQETSPPTEQYLTVSLGELRDVDYVGVAGHNFGSAGIVPSIEAQIDGVWIEIVEPFRPANDNALIFRFPRTALYSSLRMRMQAGDDVPQVAVLYIGELLMMERALWVGYVPLPYARKSKVMSGRSESGNFLGRTVVNETRESNAKFSLLDPGWFRTDMADFLAAAQETPFFFAWRPSTYPRETGYAWLMNDPQPQPDERSHLYEVELQMQGLP